MSDLRNKTPESWAEEVRKLPKEIRPMVGRIIWWDYFGGRNSEDRWNHLDEYLVFVDEPVFSDKELALALQQCGYTKQRAEYRVGIREVKEEAE